MAEQGTHRDVLAGAGDDVGKRARGLGTDLDRDLVGLELDQRLVTRDHRARRLQPAGDSGLGNGFTQARDGDVDRHGRAPSGALSHTGRDDPAPASRASSINARCSR